MKIRIKKYVPARRNEPYSKEEVELILSLAPTKRNVHLLAGALQRSPNAIGTIYALAYSPKWFKQCIERNIGYGKRTNVHIKIAEVKTKLDYTIAVRQELLKTEDHREGTVSFVEKRAPVFKKNKQ